MNMTDDGPTTTVRVDQFLAHPPATVWRALTSPDLLARWLMPGDFQLKVGHRYAMRAPAFPAAGFSGTVSAEVLAFEPEKVLSLAWRDASPDAASVNWIITWTLQPEGRGTRLFLVHQGFDPASPLQQQARKIMTAGWRTQVMHRLSTLLDQL
jgi:uncharacterized protein YndB with AHSA1/START domain